MAHVAKHHAEKEWKSCYAYHRRICLSVCRRSVSINYYLEYFGKLISFYESWPWNHMVFVRRDADGRQVGQLLRNFELLGNWSPEVSNESLILQNKLVHCFVKGFLFGKEHLVDKDGGNSIPTSFNPSIIVGVVVKMVELVLEGVARLD